MLDKKRKKRKKRKRRKRNFIFQNCFRTTAQRVSVYSLPPPDPFVTIHKHKPHNYLPKSIAHFRVHFVHSLEKMYSDPNPPSQDSSEQSHCPKVLDALPILPYFISNLWQALFTVSIVLLFQNAIEFELYCMWLSQTSFFHLRFLHICHDLIACGSLLLNISLLSLSTYFLKDILVGSKLGSL